MKNGHLFQANNIPFNSVGTSGTHQQIGYPISMVSVGGTPTHTPSSSSVIATTLIGPVTISPSVPVTAHPGIMVSQVN